MRRKTHRTRCLFRGGPADGLAFTILAPAGVHVVMPQLDLTAGDGPNVHRYTLAVREGDRWLYQYQGCPRPA